MDLKKLTSNVKQIQDYEILTLNANTEYLRGYLHGSCDKELFKKNVPVVSYDDVKPYIERVVNGEPSNVISGKPITRFLLSSGTTAGKQKIFPVNNKFFEDMSFVIALGSFLISKYEMLNRTKPAEHNQTEIKVRNLSLVEPNYPNSELPEPACLI
ncbi:LOW QUALITY PROTEIN: hypothetical protein YC2023_037727 [Brassica napus]